jgi:broad specificity phosphatase PhoE
MIKLLTMRHARSVVNEDKTLYVNIRDEDAPVSENGKKYFHETIKENLNIINRYCHLKKIDIYCSPYLRTTQTYDLLTPYLDKEKIKISYFELNPLLIEHTCYYFYNTVDFDVYRKEQKAYGSRFYYKYKNGENGVDVYNRVLTFFNYLQFKYNDPIYQTIGAPTVLLITHGFTMNVIDMFIKKLSPNQFDELKIVKNCEIREYGWL